MRQFAGMCPAGSAVILLLVTMLAGCAGLGEGRDSPAEIVDPSGEVVEPGGEIVEPGGPGASGTGPVESDPAPAAGVPPRQTTGGTLADSARSSLVAQALAARASGNSSRAIALLERAQRIDPDNGRLYLELARTHYAAGNAAQGRATAERGLLYCQHTECAELRALMP
ncbi:MAG: tetratricopeptide repeat protein [Chromatocurvus sp.]